jgi:DNA-binding HxlR family transcriptional regulator
LCNLDEQAPRRTSDVLAAINDQADERRLSPQVLSGRLRSLEHAGYIRHEDLSRLPLLRVYVLLPPGRRLIRMLSGLDVPASRACCQPADGAPR